MKHKIRTRRQSRWGASLVMVMVLCCAWRLVLAESKQPRQHGATDLTIYKSQIFGTDDRTPVSDTTQYPWSAVGRILTYYGNEIHAGTGAVIGGNIVLTAAHVVMDRNLGPPDSIQFIPGLNGSSEPFGVIDVTSSAIPPEWINSGNEDFDIAVLTLSRMIGGKTGLLPFNVVATSTLDGQTLQSAGYPSDLDAGDSMYSATGSFLGIDGNMLLELIDTEPGQSGSPIWLQSGASITMVAVIVGTRQTTSSTGQTTTTGVGTYISSDIFSWINDSIAGTNTSTPGATTFTPSMQCGTCGAGLGQAMAVICMGWTACFFSRHSRQG